jgi:hypothetical protein
MKVTTIKLGLASLALFALLAGGSLPVKAAPHDADSSMLHVEAEMTLQGYDEDVAAMNGFQIVTSPDGTVSSIPVTAEAEELLRSADSSPESRGYGSVPGPCGTSWVDIKRSAITSMTTVKTGYTVRLPTISRVWSVALYGGAGVASFAFSNLLGGTGKTWSDQQQRSYGSGGFGNVVPGSGVTLADGAICLSGSPGANF